MHGNTKNLIGKIFSFLTVIKFLGFQKREDGRNRSLWLCKCICGNKIKIIGKMLTTNQRTSCGCKKKERAIKNCQHLNTFQKKEKHPSWNHALSEEERNMNRNRSLNPNLKLWRMEIYKRCIWTCINCGSKKKLNAHHIYNWFDRKELRFNLNNGIVLCEHCHGAYHQIYGYKNNNIKQLLEFLSL